MNRSKAKRAARAAPRRAAAPAAAPGVDPSVSVGELVELDQDDLGPIVNEIGIEEKLRQWAERENVEALTVRTYVYKYENPTSGDIKVLCDRIDEDIPDPHTVGLLYGSGRYMMIVSIPQGGTQQSKAKGLRFRLHPRYDELRAKAAAGQLPVPGAAAVAPAAAPVSAGSSLKEGIEIVRGVVDMLRPLLESKAAAAPDMSHILEGQYDMVSRILSKSMSQSQDLIAEVNRAKLESAGGEDVEDHEPDFIEKIGPLLDRFLPLLLGGGPSGAATAAAVKALPEFANVVGNAHELARVVAYLDKTRGREKTDKILQALRVRRPMNGRVRRVPAPKVAAGVK